MVKSILKKSCMIVAIFLIALFCQYNFKTTTHNLDANIKVVQETLVGDPEGSEITTNTDYNKGIVEGAGRYAVGQEVSILARANAGFYFKNWQTKQGDDFVDLEDEAGNIISANPYNFIITADVEFQAVFEYLPYKITGEFSTSFDLNSIDVEYDEDIFPISNFKDGDETDDDAIENMLLQYPRATTSNFATTGKFYYRDIVTLNYETKPNKYVKQLTVNNFTSNDKKIAIINIDESDNLISSTMDGITTNYDTGTLEDVSYNFNEYNYFVLTQKLVGINFITTKIMVKTKVLNDMTFTATATEVKSLKLRAYEDDGVDVNLINIDLVKELINFEYGYYGVLDNTSISYYTYLIEVGANFSFVLTSNDFYTYKYTIAINNVYETTVRGYFLDTTNAIDFVFERKSYTVAFEEYIRDEYGNLSTLQDRLFSQYDISLFPGQTLELDVTNTSLTANSVEISVNMADIYGYTLFATSLNQEIDTETLSALSFTIDADNPENTTIYIIYKKINYNIHFNVVDSEGVISDYFRQKVEYLSADTILKKDEIIVLNGVAKEGAEILGWKSGSNTAPTSEYLELRNINFIPTSNDVLDYYYYAVVDYDYYELEFELDQHCIVSGTPMAALDMIIVDYFMFDNTSSTLDVYGQIFEENVVPSTTKVYSQILSSPTVNNLGDNVISVYSTGIGAISIIKDNLDNYISLDFSGKKYSYADSKFSKVSLASKQGYIVSATNNESEYSIKVTNLCVEDKIIMRSQAATSLYRFAYFTEDQTSTLPVVSSNNFINAGWFNLYVYDKVADGSITAVYTNKTQTILVSTNNSAAYTLNDLSCTISGVGQSQEFAAYIEISAENSTLIRISIDKNLIAQGYCFEGFIKQIQATDFIETPIAHNSLNNEYFISFSMSSDYADTNIIACFKEIVYTVNVITSVNPSAEVKYTNDNRNSPSVVSTFNIQLSNIINTPTLYVNSKTGFYISKAYINVDEVNNAIPGLVGEASKQTTSQFEFIMGDEFNQGFKYYVMDLADESNCVTLYLEQTERSYTLSIIYNLIGVSSALPISQATINCIYPGYNETNSATYQNYNAGKAYMLKIDGIEYDTDITLTVDDSEVVGAYFYNWTDYNGSIIATTTIFAGLNITDNVEININFQQILYSIQFVAVDENENPSPRGSAISRINEVPSTSVKAGDVITMDVLENTGYKFMRMYYKKLTFEYDFGIIYNGKEETGYSYKIGNFQPKIFLLSSKAEQIASESARLLTIYLRYTEKLYTISTVVTNDSDTNTTGIEVANWLDFDNLSIKYDALNDGNYVYKDLEGEELVPSYGTNSKIEVCFNSAFYGIKFVKVELGSSTYVISLLGTISIAGAECSLVKDETQGNNYYVLRFVLNSVILETCGLNNNFELNLHYEVKSYKITLTTNSNIIGDNYDITLSCQAGVTGVSSNLPVTKNNILYGTNISWSVSSTEAKNEFNKKYYFSYFLLKGIKLKEYRYSIITSPPTSAQINMTELYIDGDSSFSLWEMVANDTEIEIYAFYSPKITLNNQVFEYDNETEYFVKTVSYNAKSQKLSTSADFAGVGNPDIMYATELGGITITYNGSMADPINANTYLVTIKLDGITFSEKVSLVIEKRELLVVYSNSIITKVYDGTSSLTALNINTIKTQLALDGLQENEGGIKDAMDLNLNNLIGYYEISTVGDNINIVLSGFVIGTSLNANYKFAESLNDGFIINGKGKITAKELTVDLATFTFEDIVFKDETDYKLKYTVAETVAFRESLPLDLNDEVAIDKSKITYIINDYSIGENKVILVNLFNAMTGADKGNYTIKNVTYTINIFPYKLEYEMANRGKFMIIDKDEKCVIPIGISPTRGLMVEFIDTSSPSYPNLFKKVDSSIKNDERLHGFYKITITSIQGSVIDVSDLAGAYISLLPIKDVANIYDVKGDELVQIKYESNKQDVSIKINEDTSGEFAVLIDKSYMPIWKIIMIIGLIAVGVFLIIGGFILFKKKRKEKYAEHDKI